MSNEEQKDKNPENLKPNHIKGQHSRSIRTLLKHIITPNKREDGLVNRDYEETDGDTEYQSTSSYVKSKLNIKLLQRNKPGPSERIIKKNEEDRLKAEQQKAAAAEKVEEVKEEVKAKTEEVKAKVDEKVEETKAKVDEKVEETKAKVDEKVEETKAKAEEKVEETKAKAEEKVEETKAKAEEKVEEVKEKAQPEPAAEEAGLSFTQMLRQNNQIQTGTLDNTTEATPKEEPAKAETPKEEAPKTEEVKEEAPKAESPKETAAPAAAEGVSFTQMLRQNNQIQTGTLDNTTETAPKEEAPKTEEVKAEEVKAEEVKEEAPKAEESKKESNDDGEVKTFMDLIRSENMI